MAPWFVFALRTKLGGFSCKLSFIVFYHTSLAKQWGYTSFYLPLVTFKKLSICLFIDSFILPKNCQKSFLHWVHFIFAPLFIYLYFIYLSFLNFILFHKTVLSKELQLLVKVFFKSFWLLFSERERKEGGKKQKRNGSFELWNLCIICERKKNKRMQFLHDEWNQVTMLSV